jgi:hypothetical protein
VSPQQKHFAFAPTAADAAEETAPFITELTKRGIGEGKARQILASGADPDSRFTKNHPGNGSWNYGSRAERGGITDAAVGLTQNGRKLKKDPTAKVGGDLGVE